MPFSTPPGLVVMLLDVDEEAGGKFSLWGTTPDHKSVLIRVTDYTPYYYMPAPLMMTQHGEHEGGVEPNIQDLAKLKHVLNCR